MLQCILMEGKGNKKMCWKGMGSVMFGKLLLREKSYQPKILLLFIEGAVSASQWGDPTPRACLLLVYNEQCDGKFVNVTCIRQQAKMRKPRIL